jgi:hypothetical protein
MPFLRGRNFVRIILKSGRSSGFSNQHSTRQSRTKLKLFSSSSSCGLGKRYSKTSLRCTLDVLKIITNVERQKKIQQNVWMSKNPVRLHTDWHTQLRWWKLCIQYCAPLKVKKCRTQDSLSLTGKKHFFFTKIFLKVSCHIGLVLLGGNIDHN